jgi:hypothetical protein
MIGLSRHDELNADHDPERALPLHRGGVIRLGDSRFPDRAALFFAHHSAAPISILNKVKKVRDFCTYLV